MGGVVLLEEMMWVKADGLAFTWWKFRNQKLSSLRRLAVRGLVRRLWALLVKRGDC